MVQRVRSAGAILLGKTNTPEFGAGSNTFNPVFGATRNPYDLERTAGGSSGGAAAAVACGMLPIADGSDHGGSLRNPASFCNVVGFRPPRARALVAGGRSRRRSRRRRPDRPDRRGCGAAARRHGGPGSTGPVLSERARFQVRSSSRRRYRSPAGRVGTDLWRHDARRSPRVLRRRRRSIVVRRDRLSDRDIVPEPDRCRGGLLDPARAPVRRAVRRAVGRTSGSDQGDRRMEHRGGTQRGRRLAGTRAVRRHPPASRRLLLAVRSPRHAHRAGAAVRRRRRVPGRGGGSAHADVHRLDGVLVVHHRHRQPGDLGAVWLHRRRVAGGTPDRGALGRRSWRVASRPCLRTGNGCGGIPTRSPTSRVTRRRRGGSRRRRRGPRGRTGPRVVTGAAARTARRTILALRVFGRAVAKTTARG